MPVWVYPSNVLGDVRKYREVEDACAVATVHSSEHIGEDARLCVSLELVPIADLLCDVLGDVRNVIIHFQVEDANAITTVYFIKNINVYTRAAVPQRLSTRTNGVVNRVVVDEQCWFEVGIVCIFK